MSNMFDNYDNLQQNYVPNNLDKKFPTPRHCPKVMPCRPDKPYEMYNELGELIGYFWYYGDTVTLQFDIFGEYTVEQNAIIYYESGQVPTTETKSIVGGHCYNVPDHKVWVCTRVENGVYTWEERSWDDIESPCASKPIYVDAEDYLKGKTLYFTIYNFRGEKIYEETIEATTDAVFNVDEELSKTMVRGTYTVTLILFDPTDGTYETLFDDEDATFLVK